MPKIKRRYTEQLSVYLTPEQYEALWGKSLAEQIPIGLLIRRALVDALSLPCDPMHDTQDR